MRWYRCHQADGADRARIGVESGGSFYGLDTDDGLADVMSATASQRSELVRAALKGVGTSLDELAVLPLIDQPPSIRDFMSFHRHVKTTRGSRGQNVPSVWFDQPTFYFSNPAAIRGPREDVPIAPGSQSWDFEVELAAMIGRGGSDITVDDAPDHIAGYMLFCDWSARDLQRRESSVGLGPAKGKDTATSLGPYLVTTEPPGAHIGHPLDIPVTASVNGTQLVSTRFADLYWSFAEMVCYASRGTRLVAGDLIASGTAGGGCLLELRAIHGADQVPWLSAGDQVVIDGGILGMIEAMIVPGVEPNAIPQRDRPIA